MGGGIILDDVHEIDYACWLMGYPGNIHCAQGTFGNLEIDVEDVAEIQFTYPDKLVTIHTDYLQRQYTRRCKICLRNGDMFEWEFGKSVTKITKENSDVFSYADTFDPNQMYVEEMKLFLESVNNRTHPESDIENAEKILKIALTAKGEGQ
jgi:predicted dehydrogenase